MANVVLASAAGQLHSASASPMDHGHDSGVSVDTTGQGVENWPLPFAFEGNRREWCADLLAEKAGMFERRNEQ